MNIFQQLVQIILRQRQPQDIDFDQNAAIFYVVATAGINYITSAQSGAFTQPLLISVVQTLAQAGVLFLFLKIANKSSRFVQTATALFGITAILSILVWVIAQIGVLSLLAFILLVWSFVLTVLILRAAFDTKLILAFLLTVALGAASVMITLLVIPDYVTEALQLFSGQQAAAQ